MFKELNTLKMFFEDPEREFNVREIARILKISPATASKRLKSLVKSGLLREREERVLKLYKSDIESDKYREIKVFYNIRKVKESGLIEALNRFYLKPTIVLFGSSAYGMDTKTSDFDFLIISEKTKEFPDLEKYEEKLNRKVQLFVKKDVHGLRNPHLINNVLNGLTLQGEVKWI